MSFNSIHANSIPNGAKFVALFSDGSGARLFKICWRGDLYDCEGSFVSNAPDNYLIEAGYGYWIELPGSFKLWGER